MNKEVVIPYGAYWSTPFVRWQGSLSDLHSLHLAAHVAQAELGRRGIDLKAIDSGILGTTVPQKGAFYGVPWVTGRMGATHIPGTIVNQACATSVRGMQVAQSEVQTGQSDVVLALMADRISNGPHVFYPAPSQPGGTGDSENWVLDSFNCDPLTGLAMVQTAENVAKEYGIATQEQHDWVLCRYEQYQDALANDSAFLKRFMTLPFEVPDARLRKTVATLTGDEGITATTQEGLARLKPVLPDGTVTFGGQTHPADGNAGMIFTSRERLAEFTSRPELLITVTAIAQSRVEPGFMPKAPVPAAQKALKAAGLEIAQIDAIKTHNPFIVNDIVMGREMGLTAQQFNNFGCSLVWGHPQGPTGLRSVIELIEILVMRGGGNGLYTGCAAGDTAMALVINVKEAK